MLDPVVVLSLIICVTASVSANHPLDIRQVDLSQFHHDRNVNYRLPNTTHPVNYDISLFTRIDKDIFDFNGHVRIGLVADQTTNEIVLHARQLTISSVRLIFNSNDVPLRPFTYDEVTEKLTIPTNDFELEAGRQFILEISYSGTLRTDNGGFYRSSYINSNGSKT